MGGRDGRHARAGVEALLVDTVGVLAKSGYEAVLEEGVGWARFCGGVVAEEFALLAPREPRAHVVIKLCAEETVLLVRAVHQIAGVGFNCPR